MDEQTRDTGDARDAAGSTTSVTEAKRELRRQFRERRHAPSPADRAATAARLRAHLAALADTTQATTIHAYWPDPERGEPDLRPLLAAWHGDGRTVVLPRVDTLRPPVLTHHLWGGQPLVPGTLGLLEPDAAWPRADLARLDLVVVPALAIDRDGFRLGYGGGFYDAFLGALSHLDRPPLVACALASDLMTDAPLPRAAHDRAVDAIVTERGIHRVRHAARS